MKERENESTDVCECLQPDHLRFYSSLEVNIKEGDISGGE